MEFTMYDNLLMLPLFQGISKSDLTEILDKVKLHFIRYKAGEKIVSQGTKSDSLLFLINGDIESLTTSTVSPFSFSEFFSTPYTIDPYSLFGMNTLHNSSVTALTDCNVLKIEKSYIFSELNKYQIFRLNYMNMVSSRGQNYHDRIWQWGDRTLEERIIFLLFLLSERPSGKKIFHIKMEDLSRMLCETRSNISKTLNEMQKKEMIELHRKEIVVPALENLI